MNAIEQTFSSIYERGLWGKSAGQTFFSGSGSHEPRIVDPYVQIVSTFMIFFSVFNDRKPTVVDVGCGDFAVGRRLLPLADRYVGLDIVKDLIEHNKKNFVQPGLEFAHHDLTAGPIPKCDICCVRQVMQHLPNDAIARGLAHILPHCAYLVLTEHLPSAPNFTPNVEIPSTGSWRLSRGSGVDITQPPFSRQLKLQLPVLDVPEYGGIIRTTIYKV